MKTVVGMFIDMGEAQRTFDELTRLGLSPADISIVTRSIEAQAISREAQATSHMKFHPVQAMDAGPVAASGPIAAALGQERADLAGTLRRAGVSAALAEHYAKAVRHGETLESVVVQDRDAERVVEVMKKRAARYGTEELQSGNGRGAIAGSAAAAETTAGMGERVGERMADRTQCRDKEEDSYIPVMREEIQIGKREVERGGVHVDVRVTERPVSEHLKLREEHVEIERRPANRAPRPEEAAFRGGQLDITEHGEEAVVSKQIRVVEEIRLRKTVTEEDRVINDKLRSTEVEIDQLAGERNSYRSHFASLGAKGDFEESLPAYEYGRSLRDAKGERWEEVESNARQTWEAKRPGTWQTYKDKIQYAWLRARRR